LKKSKDSARNIGKLLERNIAAEEMSKKKKGEYCNYICIIIFIYVFHDCLIPKDEQNNY
jgi:hypothetical protein